MKELSIVIPFYDLPEVLEHYLPAIIGNLSGGVDTEIILVDATERVEIKNICKRNQVQYTVTNLARRSVQMNRGARMAKAHRLFFLHVDSVPPPEYDKLIFNAPGESGCFQLAFNPPHWFLNSFAFFTRFKWALARGGDQGLYVNRNLFNALGGFKSEWSIMEDIDMCKRLAAQGSFHVLPQKLITSSRKYVKNGVFKLQVIFTVLTVMYWLRFPNHKIKSVYRKWIK